MIKIASMVLASTFALAGTAFAADNTGSPTVSKNATSSPDLSYSDKSPIAKGSNAPMNDDAKAAADSQAPKKMHKHAKAKASTTTGTTARPDTTMGSEGTLDTGTPPTAPASGATSSSVNDTTGKSGN